MLKMKRNVSLLLVAVLLFASVLGTAFAASPSEILPIDDEYVQETPEETAPTRRPLAGALIGLFYVGETEFTETTAVQTMLTGADGLWYFDRVVQGTWWVREVSAPAGFMLNEEIFIVTITEHGQIVEVEIENIFIRGDIVGEKVDCDGYPLAGASIGLFSYNETEFTVENALEVVVTEEDGVFAFTGHPQNMYQVVELAAPEGFLLSDEILVAQIRYHGEVYQLAYSLENTRIRGRVEGIKVSNETGEPLEFAIFGLFHAEEEEQTKETAFMLATSYADGTFSFENVPFNTFWLRELAAPESYILSDEIIEITIQEQGQVVELRVYNDAEMEEEVPYEEEPKEEKKEEPKEEPSPPVRAPQTGDDTSLPWLQLILSGLGVIVVVGILVMKHAKRKQA